MHTRLSELFPYLSSYTSFEDLSLPCTSSLTKINPKEKDRSKLNKDVTENDFLFIDLYPINVAWFKGVRELLTSKEFKFKDK